MTSLAASNTTNSPSMGNTNQVTREEVDDVLLDIHTQRGTKCSVNQTVFKDPVNTADGQTYEREVIQRWFDEGKDTSPNTMLKLTNLTLTENVEIKAQVEAIEALRPLIRSILEDRKKLSRLVEADERKRKEAEAAEKERKREEEYAVAAARRRQLEEEKINRQKKEAEEQRQKALRDKYQYDLQAYKRSLGLA